MGIWDALAIGAAGVGRGYRSGQELERQLAEQKRKALLEEREAQIRERSQATQDALAQSQIGYQGVQSDLGREQLSGARAEHLREAEPASPEGSEIDVLGNKLRLPTTQGGLKGIDSILAAILREQGDMNSLRYRVQHPLELGGQRRPYLDPTEQAQEDVVDRVIQSLPKPDPNVFFTDKGPLIIGQYLKNIEVIRKKYGAKRINALMFPDSTGAGGRGGFTTPAVKP